MGGILGQGEFEDILRRVREALDEIPKQFQRLVDNINSVLDWLPGFIMDRIRDALNAVSDFIGKVLTEIGKFITQPGVPWTLWNHGTTWTDDVGAKASNHQDVFHIGTMETDDQWSGTAATAYKNTLPQQQKALGAIKSATDEVDDVLTKMAIAIGGLALLTAVNLGGASSGSRFSGLFTFLKVAGIAAIIIFGLEAKSISMC